MKVIGEIIKNAEEMVDKLGAENLTKTQFRKEGEPIYAGGQGIKIKDNKLGIQVICETKDSCRFNKNICLVGLVAMKEAIESGFYAADL